MIVICAIIGASSPEANIDIGDIKVLYLMAEDRGGHACGFTTGEKTFKQATTSYNFIPKVINHVDFPKEIDKFIGHTRYATFGDRTKNENAHPFFKKNIVGVHNGTIYNYKDLQLLFDSKAEVDSEVLYECISRFGLIKTLPLLQGILALSFYNIENDTFYLYRNNKELSLGEKNGILFWATLPEYLKAIGCHAIRSIKEHTIYQIKDGVIVTAKKVKKAYLPVTPNTYSYNGEVKYSHTPTHNIFTDCKHHLLSFGCDRITAIVNEKNKPKPKSNIQIVTPSTTKTKKQKEVEIYCADYPLKNVPMDAAYFDTQKDGEVFVWWSDILPHVLYIYNVALQIRDAFDLSIEKDMELLQKRYGLDSTDILPSIMHQYAEYQIIYEKRMKFENEKEKNYLSKFHNDIYD